MSSDFLAVLLISALFAWHSPTLPGFIGHDHAANQPFFLSRLLEKQYMLTVSVILAIYEGSRSGFRLNSSHY
jgi:hypothetical protein